MPFCTQKIGQRALATTGAEPKLKIQVMGQFIKYVGLDVHGKNIAAAVADSRLVEVRFIGEMLNAPEEMPKLAIQLGKGGARLSFCYEAGPCGYGIHRQLLSLKHECGLVAPSLIPKKAGDQVKTDRRDSLMLARLPRAHDMTACWVLDSEHEALRELARARGDLKDTERRAPATAADVPAQARSPLRRQQQPDPGPRTLARDGQVRAAGAADRDAGIHRYRRRLQQAAGGA